MLAREKIKQHDRAVQALNNLNSKEKTVNLYLELLRARDFINTKTYFYPSRPIETEIENITNSPFYQFLILLPKGGNLHVHEFQTLDRKLLLESIKNSSEYDLLYICDQNNCTKNKYYLSYIKGNVPSGWTKVKDSNWTISKIVKKTTFIGILNDLKTPLYPTDTEARWNLANQYGVFGFYADLIKYNVTRFNYMKLVLDHALEENVQLLEFRRGFFGNLFYFDKNGSRISINATEELDLLLEFKKDYLLKNPELIDFIYVIYSSRRSSKEQIKIQINNLINLQHLYPDFIRGYDMVGEEDQGHTLLFHNDNLINIFNYSKQSNNSFQLLFHAGETNWPEEHLPSNHGDGVSTFENIYDALVLRTRRIGHGLSLAKRPDMYQYIHQNQIAIEVCPASNQILGKFNIDLLEFLLFFFSI
jgi:adenosine deaminase-related growth factor